MLRDHTKGRAMNIDPTRMRVAYLTRFHYFGISGWRSDASRDIALLLDPARLEQRLEMMGDITVPSLRGQTDMAFDWFVLSSAQMTDSYKDKLRALVKSVSCNICRARFIGPDSANTVFRRILMNNYDHDQVISTVVLDDDDAVSADFTATVKEVASRGWNHRQVGAEMLFTSFPQGHSVVLRPDGCEVIDRHTPWNNQGLTLTARADNRKTVYGISHRKVGQRHPSQLHDDGRSYYLRAVHDSNDSRAIVADHFGPSDMDSARARFPLVDFARLHLPALTPQ
ncbi:glycosyltransferase [Pseudooceanicola aestuarii]|uniref:glycosyltransferase n=1 Tax=Pseudooceanicola aestuarii TaxID=2697319 RepID=UPI0013D20753|nr:glycosyltransferase [Pseudooceanicola aestuarii]